MAIDDWAVATGVLRLSGNLVDGIQAGLLRAGFPDVRPMHGFAFVRLAAAPATTVQLAAHLGVTKQATSELVGQLVDRGYVVRERDPADRRSRILVLTERGHACTRAAERAAADTVAAWRRALPARQFDALQDAIRVLTADAPLRPAW